MLAADARAEWLVHPCMSSVTAPQLGQKLERDLLAIAWMAAHTNLAPGYVNVPKLLWLWSPQGGVALPAGRYPFAELGSLIAAPQCPCSLPLDIWCRSVGFPLKDSWATQDELSLSDRDRLLKQIKLYLRTIAISDAIFPQTMDWVASVTRVVIGLNAEANGSFRSGSHEGIPGMVYLDLVGGDMPIMEALIHESAHRHLYFAEAAGPLVKPGHQQRYASPLRPEPRPLRGILLAYHALAYICCFYSEVRQRRPGMSIVLDREVQPMLAKLESAQQTLDNAARHLTNLGRSFLDRTHMVAAVARA
jgi:hypothetical protein